jgi:hypothetical protein
VTNTDPRAKEVAGELVRIAFALGSNGSYDGGVLARKIGEARRLLDQYEKLVTTENDAEADEYPPRGGHPLQPIALDEHGTARFKKNAIVDYLLEAGPFDLNQLALMPFSTEDREQLAQLIGYSVSGFNELSYVSTAACEEANEKRDALIAREKESP